MNPKLSFAVPFAAAVAGTLFALPAAAQQKGDFTIGIGAHVVDPKSGNGNLAGAGSDIGSSTRPTITGEYFIRDNLGIEVLAALPFRHSVAVGGSHIGSVKQLPPVVSLQYHFANASAFTPFVGVGVNFTTFFSESTPLGDLKLKNSRGLAAHIGVDWAMNEKSALRIDARWADIDSRATLNGAYIGTANIDPTVYGVAYVYKF